MKTSHLPLAAAQEIEMMESEIQKLKAMVKSKNREIERLEKRADDRLEKIRVMWEWAVPELKAMFFSDHPEAKDWFKEE